MKDMEVKSFEKGRMVQKSSISFTRESVYGRDRIRPFRHWDPGPTKPRFLPLPPPHGLPRLPPISVFTHPGHMAFTLIFLSSSSLAQIRVKAFRAVFDNR